MTLSETQTFIVTVVLIGLGSFVLMACGAFVGYAAAQLRSGTPKLARRQWYLLALVAAWFGVSLATSTAGLISFGLVVPFVLLPVVGGTLLSFTPRLTALIGAVPTRWLILLQTYRVAGGVFIYPYLAEGVLTRGFALNAGIGDVITGVLAVPVAWLVWRIGARSRGVFYAWTAFGVLDLVVAPASAAYFGFTASGAQPDFPITIIPLFFGPPFGILIHIITMRSFYLSYAPGRLEPHVSQS